MTVKCRPFYMSREFGSVIIMAVYVPQSTNAKGAMSKLHENISEQQTKHPKAFFIVAGDFNQASLKSVLPKFYQHVKIATRGENTLDLVHTNIKTHPQQPPSPMLAAQITWLLCSHQQTDLG